MRRGITHLCKNIEIGHTEQTIAGLTMTCTKYPGEITGRWH